MVPLILAAAAIATNAPAPAPLVAPEPAPLVAPEPAPLVAPALFEIRPYGWMKFDAVRDSARTAYGDFSFFVLPDSAAGGGEEEFTFSARDLRLGAWIAAPAQNGIAVTGRIEGDWCEDPAPGAYKPRLRLAYADIDFGGGWTLTAGQAWDTYCSAMILPQTLDPGNLGQTGNPYGRHPLLRIAKKTALGGGAALTAKLAAQSGRNAADFDKDGQADESASGAPGVHASLVLETPLFTGAPPAVFSISGAFGREKARGGGAEGAPAPDGDSTLLHLAAKIPLTKRIALQGVFFTGENIDNYLGGAGQGADPATGAGVSTAGGHVCGVFTADAGWSLGAGCGVDDPDDGGLSAGARARNGRVFVNASYPLTKALSLWAEYSHMRTDYIAQGGGREAAEAERLHFAVKYSF